MIKEIRINNFFLNNEETSKSVNEIRKNQVLSVDRAIKRKRNKLVDALIPCEKLHIREESGRDYWPSLMLVD